MKGKSFFLRGWNASSEVASFVGLVVTDPEPANF
jgi:hypothetical protein